MNKTPLLDRIEAYVTLLRPKKRILLHPRDRKEAEALSEEIEKLYDLPIEYMEDVKYQGMGATRGLKVVDLKPLPGVGGATGDTMEDYEP